MAYEAPPVGTILPAKENTTIQNPGAVHSPYGNTEWLQAQAQDKAYSQNLVLKEEWENAKSGNPAGSEYVANLGNSLSWAVVVIEAGRAASRSTNSEAARR